MILSVPLTNLFIVHFLLAYFTQTYVFLILKA
jgi:hypothetical protein